MKKRVYIAVRTFPGAWKAAHKIHTITTTQNAEGVQAIRTIAKHRRSNMLYGEGSVFESELKMRAEDISSLPRVPPGIEDDP